MPHPSEGHRLSLAQGSDGMGPEIVKSVRHTDSTSTPDFGSSYLSSWNPSKITWLKGMARVLYESANGDVWQLIRDPQSGVAMVEHKPNVSSGGRTALIEIGQFLRAGANGPEHQALLKLIGTLVND
jgi:hypothetical protein